MYNGKQDLFKISKSEMIFLKELLENEFKSNTPCDNIRVKEKILELCKKLKVSSFEEIIRIADFYKLVDIQISDDYRCHIENYSREKISTIIMLRNTMFDYAINSSQLLCNFFDNSPLLTKKEYKNMFQEEIKKINEDLSSQQTLFSVNNIVNLINLKYDFEQLFNIIFDLNDHEYEYDAEIIVEAFNSLSIKYLYTVRTLIGFAFPISLRRKISVEEKEFITFLLYKGDKIDYLKQTNISSLVLNDRINAILEAYSADTIEMMLLKAKLEIYLFDSNLIKLLPFLIFKGRILENKKQDIIASVTIHEQNNIIKLFDKMELILNRIDFYNALNDIFIICDGFTDTTFSIYGKIDKVKRQIEEKILDLNSTFELLIIINQLFGSRKKY